MYCQLSCLFPRPRCCPLPAEVRGRTPSCALNCSPLGPWQYTAELACHSSHLVPQSPVLISESLSLSFFLSYFPQFSPLVILGHFQPLPGYICVCARVAIMASPAIKKAITEAALIYSKPEGTVFEYGTAGVCTPSLSLSLLPIQFLSAIPNCSVKLTSFLNCSFE